MSDYEDDRYEDEFEDQDDRYDEPDDDGEDEFDYGDEDSEGDDNIVDFSFRQMDQIGLAENADERNDARFGSQVEGAGRLAQIQQKRSAVNQTPDEEFRNLVSEILTKQQLRLNLEPIDSTTINRFIGELNLPKFKNPLAYVLGYIAYTFHPPGGNSRIDQDRRITSLLSDQVNMNMVIRYSRLWERLAA